MLQLLKLKLAVSDVGFATLVSRLQELHYWHCYKQMLMYHSVHSSCHGSAANVVSPEATAYPTVVPRPTLLVEVPLSDMNV